MTTVADIIRAQKTNISTGEWKTGKIPNSAFPLARGTRSIPVGPSWSWRLCEFEALGFRCRVLIRLNAQRERYHAVLGVEVDGQFRVVCHHELHTPDKGWHCHFVMGDVLNVLPGVMRDTDRIRVWENSPSTSSKVMFNVTQVNALTHAADRYRFQAQGNLL